MIFVTIAAYRDPELWPTVEHALSTAAHPSELQFAICLQESEDQLGLPEHLPADQIELISVPYHESKGCCWARAELQKLYRGQEFTLQLDSHHRFVEGWDAILIEMLLSLERDHPKVMVTSYLPPYLPEQWPAEQAKASKGPCKIVATRFSEDWSTVQFAPRYFSADAPLRTAFFSAHFFFCRGTFHREIAYDPQIYFTGEEDTLAQRLFTRGWQLFAPHRTLAYHHYTRAQRAKHWEDNGEWWRLNAVALDRVDAVLEGEQSRVGCGARPVEEYWQFAGVNYALQTIQPWAAHGYCARHVSTTPTDLWVHSEGYFQKRGDEWVENNRCRFEQRAFDRDTVLYDEARDVTLTLTSEACCYQDQVLYRGCWIKR